MSEFDHPSVTEMLDTWRADIAETCQRQRAAAEEAGTILRSLVIHFTPERSAMKPCTGCRHLIVLRGSGSGVCRWPERHGVWRWHTDALTGQRRRTFAHADGRVEETAVWRPRVEDERATEAKCGPDAQHYEPTLWTKLVRLLRSR